MLLSIGMIVRDEEKNLRSCLNGLKPILEQVDSELIIADTGSADATVNIAEEFTLPKMFIRQSGEAIFPGQGIKPLNELKGNGTCSWTPTRYSGMFRI